MYGLDRACVFVDVKTDILYVRERIKIMFPHSFSESLTNYLNNYKIDKRNINYIKLEEKKLKRITTIKIDFSYPRFFSEDNIYPLSDELKKTTVEDNLVKLINKLIDYEITINDIKYEYFEFTTQEFVGNFYKFHNIISYFFKALTRKYNDLDKVQYYNFDKNQNKFYTTGFTFQPTSGWKIRLYSKGHENNKKNFKKVKGAIFRLEHRLSKKIIKNYFEFNSVNSIKIEEIKKCIQSTISQALGKIMIEEIEKSVEVLKEKFVDFRCQDLDSLVRDNLEWIFDYKIIDDIVTSSSNKCYRQIVFYRSKIKNILIHSQQRASPQRDFFSNIERLEQFLVNIILFNCKIKCDTKNHLAFFGKK